MLIAKVIINGVTLTEDQTKILTSALTAFAFRLEEERDSADEFDTKVYEKYSLGVTEIFDYLRCDEELMSKFPKRDKK